MGRGIDIHAFDHRLMKAEKDEAEEDECPRKKKYQR